VKATQAEIARQLQGNWQEDLLFRLGQELAAYGFYQTLITQCDQELAKLLRAFPIVAPELRLRRKHARADARRSGGMLRNLIYDSCCT
jgi:hypothetical protein